MIAQKMTVQVLDTSFVQPKNKKWSYADYLQLPDDGKRYEIIEGVLYMANAPSSEHQFTVGESYRQISNFVIEHKLGRVIVAPFEVHLSEHSRPVQPDVLFIKAERLPIGRFQFFEGAPDLIIEVISPESVRRDRVTKFTAYEQAGVAEYWLINPPTQIVEIYTLSNGEYALLGEFHAKEQIQSLVLEGITIVTDSLFG